MSSRYSAETVAYAAARGITADELPLIIDGCSGGVSWAYGIAKRTLACEGCCDRHDIDYQLGGDAAARLAADARLRQCAASAGLYPPGWRGWLPRTWGSSRAWAMYAAVRVFGGRYWTWES